MKHIQTILLGTSLWLMAPVWVVADAYLDALEAEAQDTGERSVQAGEATAAASLPTEKAVSIGVADTIKQGLTFAGFEEELAASYSGSHFLYIKLSEAHRKSVFRFYIEDNRVESIREEIVRQLSSE